MMYANIQHIYLIRFDKTKKHTTNLYKFRYKSISIIESISNNEKYNGCVFSGRGIYFVIGKGALWEISDDASCSPRGGWFPDIVSGPTAEENKCLEAIMEKYVIDEYFFSELIDDCGEFDDEYVLEYYEDKREEFAVLRREKAGRLQHL